jgi:hypothetical protein
MDYNQRTSMIGSWLQGILKRYTPPSSMDRDTLGQELQLIVEDINNNIPSSYDKIDLEVTLKKIDGHVRQYQASRTWPTIKTFIMSTKAAVDEYSRNTEILKVISQSKLDPAVLMVKRIKSGDAIPDWILDPDSIYRQQLLLNTDLVESDFNKYLDTTATMQ